MIRAGVGYSQKQATELAVEEAAGQALGQAGIARADLAMIFFTADHAAHSRELAAALVRSVGTDCVMGASGAGVLTGDGEIEGGSGIAVLVWSAPEIVARPFIFEPLKGNEENLGTTFGDFLAKTQDQSSLMILLPDTYNGNPQPLLDAMAAKAGFHPVVGAGSSENGAVGATFQLCGNKVTSNSLAGAYISGEFKVHVDITQGCQPITEPMVITKAERNLIHEIDGRPALEVFARLLKGPLAEDLRRALMVLFVGLPADRQENSVAPGKYLVRNIIGLDPEKGIVGVAESVSEGEALIFTMRDGQRAREDLNQMLRRQAEKLQGRKPGFGMYFNCCARGGSLYGIPGIDSAYIRQALGDFPLIGMFGGYELAPLGRANHLFAYTGVLALIAECD
ncbi:MAG TPA: FIST N-terminal domain-containing protein [Candidatus Binatia bacterium]|nr:FIST N-terminal domain-containing protein [Candidatus Binatia bacterium]